MRFLLFVGLFLFALTASCRTSDKRSNNAPAPTPVPTDNTAQTVAVGTETGLDFKTGNPQAPLKLEYFADLLCGACKAMSPIVADLQKAYPDKILWVFKNYPKDTSCNDYQGPYMHEYSCEAALATRCVGLYKDKFWDMKDRVFANQTAVKPETLQQWAKGFGMTDAEYDQCYTNGVVMEKVKADVAEGKGRGVTGTPTIFINNVKVYPATKAKLEAEIKRQLGL